MQNIEIENSNKIRDQFCFVRATQATRRKQWDTTRDERVLEHRVTWKRTDLLVVLIGFSALGKTWTGESFVSHTIDCVKRVLCVVNKGNATERTEKSNSSEIWRERERETVRESYIGNNERVAAAAAAVHISRTFYCQWKLRCRLFLSHPASAYLSFSSKSISETKIQFDIFILSWMWWTQMNRRIESVNLENPTKNGGEKQEIHVSRDAKWTDSCNW